MPEFDLEIIKGNMTAMLKWVYWITGVIIVSTISYVLYTRFNKQVASILVFIASMMALYYYYVKWFIIGQSMPIPSQVCPDFMTSVGMHEGQTFCVDYTGNYPNFKPAEGSPTVTELKGNAVIGIDGHIYNTGTGASYVVTPGAGGSIESYCGLLKNQGISHINLCSFN
jgi:hypothetical protein